MRAAAPGGLAEHAQHARMIGTGVVADAEYGVAVVEIFQRHGCLAHAQRLGHACAGGFVAHVGTVGEIVGAEPPTEQLVQEGGFVGGAAGGVQLQPVGMVEFVQDLADACERVPPGSRPITIAVGVVDHRLAEAAGILEVVVGPLPQLADRMRVEEDCIGAALGRFPGHCLGAVLAEFEMPRRVLVGPGAAHAVKTIRLVQPGQRAPAIEQDALPVERAPGSAQRTPAARGPVVGPDAPDALVAVLVRHAASPPMPELSYTLLELVRLSGTQVHARCRRPEPPDMPATHAAASGFMNGCCASHPGFWRSRQNRCRQAAGTGPGQTRAGW